MKTLFIILILTFSFSSKGQRLSAKLINEKADSIVISYWGKSNFKRYIRLDRTASEYAIEYNLSRVATCPLDKPLKFKPNQVFYRYRVLHPLFKTVYYPIQFYLDSTGQIERGVSGPGLIKHENLDSLETISKDSAISVAKKAGLKKNKKWTTEIGYYDPVTRSSSINSELVWMVKSYYAQPHREGCLVFPYSVMFIDAKTGAILGTDE